MGKTRLLQDSLGNSIKSGDMILCYRYYKHNTSRGASYYTNSYRTYEIVSLNGEDGYCLVPNVRSNSLLELDNENYHIIKLNLTREECDDYFTKTYDKYVNRNQQLSYDDIKSNITLLMETKETNYIEERQAKNLRGMPLVDIYDRELALGEMVYFFDNDMLGYGIVCSDTQVFSNYLEIKTVHHVIKVPILSQEEINKKQRLALEYGNLARTLQNMSEVHVGDIYKSKGKTHVYFGTFGLKYRNMTFQYDDCWVTFKGVNIDILDSFRDKEELQKFINLSFSHFANIDKDNIVGFRHIDTEISKRSYYVGHIDIQSLNSFNLALDFLKTDLKISETCDIMWK